MKLHLSLFAILIAATVLARADLIAHYDFDTVDTFDGVPYTNEVTSDGGDWADAGSRATFDQNCRRLGTGSLVVKNLGGTETSGNDGAVTSNTFNWGATGFNSDVRTVAFWMKAAVVQTDAQPTMISMGAFVGGNGQRFDVRLDAGRLRLELQGQGFTTSTVLNDNQWHHVAIVVPLAQSTLGDVKYYVDGGPAQAMTGTLALTTATSPLRMGDSYQDSNRDFTGALDDVRLYNEALDDAAISALYNDGVAKLPGILCFESSSTSITAGQTVDLSWEIDPSATSATLDNGIGDVLSNTIAGQGLIPVSPTTTTTYTLTLERGGETIQQQVTVDVASAEPLVLISNGFASAGIFQLTARNMVQGVTYQLEFGDDLETLVTSPRTVTNFTAASSVRVLLDSEAPAGRGFYRLVENP
jgi:hypothetical protein